MELRTNIEALFYAVGRKLKTAVLPKLLKAGGAADYLYFKNTTTDYDADWSPVIVASTGVVGDSIYQLTDVAIPPNVWTDVGMSLVMPAGSFIFCANVTMQDSLQSNGYTNAARIVVADLSSVITLGACSISGSSGYSQNSTVSLKSKVTTFLTTTTIKVQAFTFVSPIVSKAKVDVGTSVNIPATFLSYLKV